MKPISSSISLPNNQSIYQVSQQGQVTEQPYQIDLSIFDRIFLQNERTYKKFGLITIHQKQYLQGKVSLFEFLDRFYQVWHIKNSNQSFTRPQKREFIDNEVILHQCQKSPTLLNRMKKQWVLLKNKALNILLPKKITYTAIVEPYGDHSVEGVLIATPKTLIFIRNKRLIKIANDLQLLRLRGETEIKEQELGIKVNSFNMIFDNDLKTSLKTPKENKFNPFINSDLTPSELSNYAKELLAQKPKIENKDNEC